VPLHLLGQMDGGASHSSIEMRSMEYVQYCLTPWIVKIEEECDRKLLLESEKKILRARLNIDSLLRGITLDRYQAYNLALQGCWKTRNEVRALEGLPPMPGGDVLLQPLNMSPANGQITNPRNPPAGGGQSDQTRRLVESTARRLTTKETHAISRAA